MRSSPSVLSPRTTPLRGEPQPLSRSQLARRDYVPEPPVVLPAPKKSRFKRLIRALLGLVRPAIILIIVGLGVLAVKTYNDWFAQNFAYGVVKTPSYWYHGNVVGVGDVILDEPLPDGRLIKVHYKGHAPNVSQLPSIEGSELGDMWYTQDDGNCWVLTTLTPTSSVLGWVDP